MNFAPIVATKGMSAGLCMPLIGKRALFIKLLNIVPIK
jgi:hypothetical protein